MDQPVRVGSICMPCLVYTATARFPIISTNLFRAFGLLIDRRNSI
jgi:hypothetical protein